MLRGNFEVQILVNGNPVKEYYKDGQVYVEGREGQKYSIKIRNMGYNRILAVPTVDGLSVMDGKPASFDSNGYIIDGYDSLTIDGWRTSDKEVAEFFFSCHDHAYAELKGKGGNQGVIGVAVFNEKEYYNYQTITYTSPLSDYDWNFPSFPRWNSPFIGGITLTNNTANTTLSTSGTALTGASASAGNAYFCSSDNTPVKQTRELRDVEQKLGTGFGESKKSEVTKVSFHRENGPSAVFEIKYNTRQELEKMGIDFTSKPVYVPNAFPGEYCTPPEDCCRSHKNCKHQK